MSAEGEVERLRRLLDAERHSTAFLRRELEDMGHELRDTRQDAQRVIDEYARDLRHLTDLFNEASGQLSNRGRWLREQQTLAHKAVRRKVLADYLRDKPSNRLKWAREFCEPYRIGNYGGLPKPLAPKTVVDWIRKVHGPKKPPAR